MAASVKVAGITPPTLKALDGRLQQFLEDLLEPMGRRERRHWARLYVHGLLLDGERKSIEPLAARVGGADVQALRQFVGQSPWAVEEVQRRLALKMVDLRASPRSKFGRLTAGEPSNIGPAWRSGCWWNGRKTPSNR